MLSKKLLMSPPLSKSTCQAIVLSRKIIHIGSMKISVDLARNNSITALDIFIYMNICSYVYITSKEIKCQYKIIFNIYQILFTLVLTIFTLYQISFYQEFMCYISWQLMFRFNGVIHLRHLLICNRMIQTF